MYTIEQRLLAALEDVASCQENPWPGGDIQPIIHAISVLALAGPIDVPVEHIVRLVLDVRRGRKSPRGAMQYLFRGDYS